MASPGCVVVPTASLSGVAIMVSLTLRFSHAEYLTLKRFAVSSLHGQTLETITRVDMAKLFQLLVLELGSDGQSSGVVRPTS
jgi:hypothetical protein